MPLGPVITKRSRPVGKSQIRIQRSPPEEASVAPSGEKTNEGMLFECPSKVDRMRRVAVSHSEIFPPCCPTARVAPSGAKARQEAPALAAIMSSRARDSMGDEIVKGDRCGLAADGKNPIVGAEGSAHDVFRPAG